MDYNILIICAGFSILLFIIIYTLIRLLPQKKIPKESFTLVDGKIKIEPTFEKNLL